MVKKELISDYVGEKSHKLTINKIVGIYNPTTKRNNLTFSNCLVEALCECGNTKIIKLQRIFYGYTKSCGCLIGETRADANRTHGKSKTKEYISWVEMRKRCRNPKVNNYSRYGGIGVEVCDRWYNSFELFLEDMGFMPEGKTSLDRYPNKKGNYEPDNCRWADDYEQSNNRDCNIVVYIDGVKMSLAEAGRFLGFKRGFLQNRIKRGATINEAILTGLKPEFQIM